MKSDFDTINYDVFEFESYLSDYQKKLYRDDMKDIDSKVLTEKRDIIKRWNTVAYYNISSNSE